MIDNFCPTLDLLAVVRRTGTWSFFRCAKGGCPMPDLLTFTFLRYGRDR
jgi:hypothetical protein